MRRNRKKSQQQFKTISCDLQRIVNPDYRWKMAIFEHWDLIIGSLKGNVFLHKVNGSQLILGVSHPAWAQELQYLFPLLKKKVNSLFDQEVIQNIRFTVVDKRPSVDSVPEPIIKTIQKNLLFQSLSAQERNMLNKVEDETLRLSLEQFLVRCREEMKGDHDEFHKEIE